LRRPKHSRTEVVEPEEEEEEEEEGEKEKEEVFLLAINCSIDSQAYILTYRHELQS
jgi:hypothetical protein